MRFSLVLIISILCILPFSYLDLESIRDAEAYTDYYVPVYYPYSTYASRQNYFVTISISDLPSDRSTSIQINGNDEGTIQGGSSREFEVRSTESHNFQVQEYVSGADGVRYVCRENSWTFEKTQTSNYPYNYPYYYPYYYYTAPHYYTNNSYSPVVYSYYYYPGAYYYPYYYPSSSRSTLEASHTFSYEPEYMLTVDNAYGQSIDKAGWWQKGAVVTLSTSERIEQSDQERKVFKAWNIDGTEMFSNTITLTMNKPYKARSIYQSEYYIQVNSERGHPQGSSWYREDSMATISVDPEVAMAGFWGSIGAKNVFDRWDGMTSGDQFSPTTEIVIENPMVLTAMWRSDYSMAYITLAIILSVILILIIVGIIVSIRGLPEFQRRAPSSALDNLNIRYSQGEITREEYLKMKKDIQKS